MISFTEYKKAETLQEAWELNQKRNNVIVGGMHWLKMSKKKYNTAIDLSNLGLDKIEEDEDTFSIGCMVSLRQLETNDGLNKFTDGAIKESLRHIVGVQFRNTATLGGSIFGRYGFSDVLTMFSAADTYVELFKGGIVPLEEYAKMKYDNDIVVRLIVKKHGEKFSYQSVRNSKTDFPILACAVSKKADKLKIAIGARPLKAVVFKKDFDGTSIDEIASDIAENVVTGTNLRASSQYRKHLAKVLVRRACEQILSLEEEAK